MVDNPFIPKNINQALIYQDDNGYNREHTYNNHHVELIDADERFVQMLPVSNGYTNQPNEIYSIAAKSFKKYNDVQLSQEDQYLEMTKNTNKQFSKIVACIEEYEKESKPVTLKRLKKYAEDGAKYTDKKLKTNAEDIVVTPIEQEKTSTDLFFAVQQREKYESMFRWATCYEEGQK
ncbi:uncharacterized protein RHIMIDRAFT_293973 [Rhizopus microsporus ATCC 52813]|uniref:Uncharacterized protein n=1 Tax=Rhizopus microsporus ATCC 52813 TaxID=1340429 RepID=A0A2G4SML7_RHIZD|nr:uncharacterized protein RHIMIDRAFT_293973 [Rhizopus microsporus ATCC 52813]PHZ10028.1 hypothetical protein RHIMIDRAFT_293973 [Rhizopus microsporus ATCC 52813]